MQQNTVHRTQAYSRQLVKTLSVMTAVSLTSLASRPVLAAVPGFTEDFLTDTGTFFSGATIVHEPGGGVGGAGDGYLSISRSIPENLGVASSGPEFTGNLTADGVTGFSFWLNDIGADDPLELHVGVGNSFGNFWLYTAGFSPPNHQWAQYTVDFSGPSDWVLIRGSGTFEQALSVSDRILIRHDLAPFGWFPDEMVGDFGLDRVTVLPEPGVIALLAFGGVWAIARRRSR